MAGVAQLVRASVCGTEGRRFNPGRSPHMTEQDRKLCSKVPYEN